MANVSTPFGAKPVKMLNGAPYSATIRVFSTAAGDSTALYKGDFVKLAGTGQTINGVVYLDVTAAATGDVIAGVVTGVVPATRDSTIYRAASTATLVTVETGQNVLFEMQEVNSGTAFTANDLGLNCNFVVAAGSTVTGVSGTTLDNSTEATTNTLDLKLVDFVNRADNEIGTAAKWLVAINRSQWANQVAGI